MKHQEVSYRNNKKVVRLNHISDSRTCTLLNSRSKMLFNKLCNIFNYLKPS
jgi:hypothetical protein